MIAYLLLCHRDPQHIFRLAQQLSELASCHVFIHIDLKVASLEPWEPLHTLDRVHIISERYEVWWGGISAVRATYALMRAAMLESEAQRFVLLQGAVPHQEQ